MAVFKKLSQFIPFTKSELAVISFLLISAATGTLLRSTETADLKPLPAGPVYSESEKLFLKALNSPEADSEPESKQVSKAPAAKLAPGEKIDINQAGIADLIKLPGIGGVLAKKILEFRQNIGYFRSIQDLLKVKGIGNSKFDKIKDYIYIKN